MRGLVLRLAPFFMGGIKGGIRFSHKSLLI
jgi:hypothetical protein